MDKQIKGNIKPSDKKAFVNFELKAGKVIKIMDHIIEKKIRSNKPVLYGRICMDVYNTLAKRYPVKKLDHKLHSYFCWWIKLIVWQNGRWGN